MYLQPHRFSTLLLAALTGAVVCLLCPSPAAAQRITVFNVDTTSFPIIHADIYVTRDDGSLVRNLDEKDFVVRENGSPVRPLLSATCPPQDALEPISIALVCDRSGSININTVKSAALAFVRAVRFEDRTAVAVTAFDNQAIVVRDFTNDLVSLVQGINGIVTGGGTEYDPAFLDPVAGAIPLLGSRPAYLRRVIVFLTDGSPNIPPDVQRIIIAATALRVKVYPVTLGVPMIPDLQAIADATGGTAYGNVKGGRELEALLASIVMREQRVQPCHITWEAGTPCDAAGTTRRATITYLPWPDSTTVGYSVRPTATRLITISAAYVWFGAIPPGQTGERTVNIDAPFSPLDIADATIDPPGAFTIVGWGGSPPPFTLSKQNPRTITIRFTPTDSTVSTATLSFRSGSCPLPTVMLSGGLWNPEKEGVLRLDAPIGGETFDGCDSITVRWSGVPPGEPVRIEYSAGPDSAWRPIVEGATDYSYNWRAPSPGRLYRVRVSLMRDGGPDSIRTVAGGGAREILNGVQALDVRLDSPSGVALDGPTLYFTEPARNAVRMVDLRFGTIATAAGTGTRGYSGDGTIAAGAQLDAPGALAFIDGMLYIADRGNNRVRRLNTTTGIITTLAGTGTAGSDGEDGPAALAQLSSPAALAAAHGRLFISDSGSGRILVVDLAAGTIGKIWFDGPTTALAIAPASNGIDDTLYFIREPKHEIWRFPLRGFAEYFRPAPQNSARPTGLCLHGDDLLLSDENAQTVIAVHRSIPGDTVVAGTGTPGFSGEHSPANVARLNRPQGIAATGTGFALADAGNNRVRIVRMGTALRSDESRTFFSVSTGRLRFNIRNNTVGMGAVGVGIDVDTLIAQAICNVGDQPLAIDSFRIEEPNAADFTIRMEAAGLPLAPGECRRVEIGFRAGALGPRAARLVIFGGCAEPDTVALIGTGIAPCRYTTLSAADFGAMNVGAFGDTVLKKALCNHGDAPIAGRIGIQPADGPFTIVGATDYRLAPGECFDVAVRFAPRGRGAVGAVLTYGLPRACGIAGTALRGRGLGDRRLEVAARFSFGDVPCATWPRDTAVTVTNAGDLPLAVTGVSLPINQEGFSILSPIPTPAAPLVIAPDSSAAIRVRLNPSAPGALNATLRIESNDAASPADVAMTARRDSFGLMIDPPLMVFDGTLQAIEYPIPRTCTLRNTGTVAAVVIAADMIGTDASAFRIVGPAMPLQLLPGASATITVEALAPSGGSAKRAVMRLGLASSCDSAWRDGTAIETGAAPEIMAEDLAFAPLRCDAPVDRQGVVTVRNVGGSPLDITGWTIGGGTPGAFVVDTTPPVNVPPGASVLLPVRFVPGADGDYTATLHLESNAPAGRAVLVLSGRREHVALRASASPLEFGTVPNGSATTAATVLFNAGTGAALLVARTTGGAFSIIGTGSIPLAAGDSVAIPIRFEATAEGEYVDTLVVVDLECGTLLRVPLHGRIGPGARAVVRLPIAAAHAGERVRLPLTVAVADPGAFAASGAARFNASITFDGTLLFPDSVAYAAIVDARFDANTGMQTMTMQGTYDAGDTLALLFATVPFGPGGVTPLRFTAFEWDVSAVTTDTINGAFTAISGCGPATRLTARILGAKVRPHPLSAEGAIEFDIEDEQTVRLRLRDLLGRAVLDLGETRLAAGHHSLPLHLGTQPAGAYRLEIVTPFGGAWIPLLLVR